jgi:hypothetical protein
MTTDKVAPPALAPPPQQQTDVDLRILCEKIRKEVVLTPPAIIDALCEGEPTQWICHRAIYVEEVLEVARILNRGHLLNFKADC